MEECVAVDPGINDVYTAGGIDVEIVSEFNLDGVEV